MKSYIKIIKFKKFLSSIIILELEYLVIIIIIIIDLFIIYN